MALTKDRNFIPRIELSITDTSHPLNCIFYYFLIIFYLYFFNKRIYCSVTVDAPRGSFRGICYSSIAFSIHRPLVCTLLLFVSGAPSRIMLCQSTYSHYLFFTVISRGLTHDFWSILVLLVPLQKNQEMLHTKSTYLWKKYHFYIGLIQANN